MPHTDQPIIQGWLNKMKSSRMAIGGHWNRRWVTIQNIGGGELALCYWNGPNDSSDPSGWIFIKEIDEVKDALSELPTNFRLGDKQKAKDSKASKYDYIQEEIKKHKYTTFIITAMSRNFVFSAEDEDSTQHWLACLFRLCGIPFDKYPWLKRWGEVPKVPELLKDHWNKIRRDSPYRDMGSSNSGINRSGKTLAYNSSSRITNTRVSVQGNNINNNNSSMNNINNRNNNIYNNKNSNYRNSSNKNSNGETLSNRSSNQSFAGSPYHSDNSGEEDNLNMLKTKREEDDDDKVVIVKKEEIVEEEEKKSYNNEPDVAKPPIYVPKNKNKLPVDLITPVSISNSSETKGGEEKIEDNIINQKQQLQVNMFETGSTSPCGIVENDINNHSRSDSISSDVIPTPIPTVTPTCFNNNIESEILTVENNNNNTISNNHFETTIHFKDDDDDDDDDDYDDWDDDKNEEKKSEVNEESKIESFGNNVIYDNTIYKAGVKEDENWLTDDFDS